MHKDKFLDEELDKISNENSKLVPFIGAGISRIIVSKNDKIKIIPTWDDLNQALLEEIGQEDKYDSLKNDPLEVAEYYIYYTIKRDEEKNILKCNINAEKKFRYGKSKLVEVLKKRLKISINRSSGKYSITNTEIDNLEIHLELKKKFPMVYTTNWDNLLEEITNYEPIYVSSQLIKPSVRDRKGIAIHFHGYVDTDIEQEGHSFVCCKTDYIKRILHENPFDVIFKNDFLSNYFIFAGYSFRDPNVLLVIYQINELLGRGTNKAYWLVTDYKDDPRLNVFSETNIEPVYLLSKDDRTTLQCLHLRLQILLTK